jgi:hypothetical protein
VEQQFSHQYEKGDRQKDKSADGGKDGMYKLTQTLGSTPEKVYP